MPNLAGPACSSIDAAGTPQRRYAPTDVGPQSIAEPGMCPRGDVLLGGPPLAIAPHQELAADLDPRRAVIGDDVGGGVGLVPV